MKKLYFILLLLALTAVAFSARPDKPATQESKPLLLVEEIPLPNVAGRFDHLTLDFKHLRIILCALGNNSLEVVDLFGGKALRSVPGVSAPQDALYIPEFDQLVVSSAGDRAVRIYDAADYTFRKAYEFGEDTDNLRYDPGAKRVLIAYGGSGSGAIGIIDLASGKRVAADIRTAGGGHPEAFLLEKSGARLFVNVPDDGAVEVFDSKTGGLLAKWPLSAAENHAMALDEANHRLFTFAREPALMLVLNTDTGKEVARLPAVGDPDDAHFDAYRKRIYATGSEGLISVFHEKDPDHYEVMDTLPTGLGARTSLLLTFGKHGRFYVAVPARAGQPARILTYLAQ